MKRLCGITNRATARLRSGFTLIEVLVVVAIIALLIAVLLPSLSKAKEKARQSVCLSNQHQQGVGFAAYASENRQMLPMVGHFRYTLAEGKYYTLGDPNASDWIKVNNGLLYRKYVGGNPEVFYCPSNTDADANGNRGMNVFLQRYQHPRASDPQYVNSHDAANSPIGAYTYALPVVAGQSPRDAGPKMYPVEAMIGGPYYMYMTDPTELTDQQAMEFLGHFPQNLRGKHSMHALLTDAYFGGYRGYHLNGFNVLYSDYHAKRVPDPAGKIIKGVGGGSRYTPGDLATAGKAFMVWDYFSRNP
ncbi:MAG: type II secretion system protein [Phycisphaerae bacterium]